MTLYDRRVVTQQNSVETECTDALLKRHQPAVIAAHNSSGTDDDIFSGRRLQPTGSTYTSHSINAKPTPATLEESLSGDYQQFGVQHPSVSYNESGTYEEEYERGQQRHSMNSYEEGDYPPEEQYYQDQYLHADGQCYTDDGEPYYGDEEGQQHQYHHHDQRDDHYYDDGYSYEEQHMRGHDAVFDHHKEENHDDSRYNREQPYRTVQHQHYEEEEQYYEEATQGSYNDYPRDYQGDQDPSYARQNEDGTWEEGSEAYGTVTSKTLNTNLEGMNFLQEPEAFNNNYYGEEETAFDYSISQYPDRAAPPQIPYDGASTLASPVNDDDEDRSHGSNSVWDGEDLRNRSLLDSPLSQNDYTVDHTEYTEQTERRPVSKFIKKVNNNVGKFTNVRYKDGEFRIQQSSRASRDGGSREGSRSGSRKKAKKPESATILDIMYNVGHDLIVGTPDRGSKGRRRKPDPAAKIVDGFKDLFSCNGGDDDDSYY